MSRIAPYIFIASIAIFGVGIWAFLDSDSPTLNEVPTVSLDADSPNTMSSHPIEKNSRSLETLPNNLISPTEEVDEIPVSADGIVGPFGTVLADPWIVYSENIEPAKAGDTDAQFLVSDALFACKGLPTQEYYDQLIRDSKIDADMASAMQARMDFCAELLFRLGKETTEDWRYWLDESANGGHSIAAARRIAFSPFKFEENEARRVFEEVLRSGSNETYSLMVSYFANYRPDDYVEYESWLYLSCLNNPTCDAEDHRGPENPPLRPAEQELVDQEVARISSALRNREYELIEL